MMPWVMVAHHLKRARVEADLSLGEAAGCSGLLVYQIKSLEACGRCSGVDVLKYADTIDITPARRKHLVAAMTTNLEE